MRSDGTLGRLSVLLVFVCLAAAAALAGRTPAAPAGIAADDVRKLGGAMAAGARLHGGGAASPPPGTAAFCRECHPPSPHPGPGIAPAMLNAHAARLDCLFCHWSDAAGPRPRPAWQPWPPGRSGERLLQLALWPPPGAQREELARVRAAATVGRRCFGRGPACGDCHRPGGITPWARPGAPAARAAGLERLEDYFRLPPGEKWYFPQFQ